MDSPRMIGWLKKTILGKVLYRFSRSSLGTPLRHLASLLQHEAIQLAHLVPSNRQHNQEQIRILTEFDIREKD